MDITWDEHQPIYRQLMATIVNGILDGSLADGEAVPSIRNVAEQYQVNPLTASKAYQELSNIDILEKKRGIGLFVRKGTRARLLQAERKKFLNEEWPEVLTRIDQLGLDVNELLKGKS